MNSRPKILITGPDKGGMISRILCSVAVRVSGGIPIYVHPKKEEQIKTNFDGLILMGGTDINPNLYKKTQVIDVPKNKINLLERTKQFLIYPLEGINNIIRKKKVKYDTQRDLLERKYFVKALSKNKPVLGICRGHQLINVLLGGTLYKSTRFFYKKKPRIRTILPRKKLYKVSKDSVLDKTNHSSKTNINALHNQAVASVAPSLKVVAKEKTGIIQAMEHKDKNILTVQWHPEFLLYKKSQLNVFKWLVSTALSSMPEINLSR